MPDQEDSQASERPEEPGSAPPIQNSQPFVSYQTGPVTQPATSVVPGAPWWIALVAIGIAELAVGFFLLKSAKSVPTTLGIALVVSAALCALFLAILGKRAKIGWNIGSAVVILGAMYIGAVPGYVARAINEKDNRNQMSNALSSELNEFMNSSGKDDEAAKLKPLDTTSKSKGAWGEVESFIRKLTNDVIAVRNGYTQDLEDIKWSTILDAQRLSKDKDFSESRAMIVKAKKCIKARCQETLEVIRKSRLAAERLDTSHQDVRDFVAGYRSGAAKSRRATERSWDLEAQTIDEFDAIIAILDKNRGKWVIEDDQVLFEDDAALNAFNKHLARIEEIVKIQEEIQRKGASTMKKGLDVLGR